MAFEDEDDDFTLDELLFELVRSELELCITIGSIGVVVVGVVAAPPQADKTTVMLNPAINCTIDLMC